MVLLRGFFGLMQGFFGLLQRFWRGALRHFFFNFNARRRHTSPPPQALQEHIKRATSTETLPMARLTPARSTSGAHWLRQRFLSPPIKHLLSPSSSHHCKACNTCQTSRCSTIKQIILFQATFMILHCKIIFL